MTGAIQYDRWFTLTVGNSGGTALELDQSDFRVTFQVRRGDFQCPNSLDARIYNLSTATANKIANEFTRIVLQAGYDGNYGLIFDGTIKQVRQGRIDGKDSYVDVTAADGDKAYNFSTMALSLAAGTKPADQVQAFVQSLTAAGVGLGYVPKLSTNGTTRGRVFYGMTRDELRDFAAQNDCTWSIQDGKLCLIPLTAYIPGDAPVISPSTGLIGVPEQTANGLSLRALLNPSIKIGQRIKLDSAVSQYRYGLDLDSQKNNPNIAQSNTLNKDGLYYVMTANHSGDTRGNEWYTDLTCLAVDATIPQSQVDQAAVNPDVGPIKPY